MKLQYKKNQDSEKAKRRSNYVKNKESEKAKRKDHYEKNKKSENAKMRIHYKENKIQLQKESTPVKRIKNFRSECKYGPIFVCISLI